MRPAARRTGSGWLFIRSLVGLDREAATEAFGEFLAGRTLTANQINFVNLIITHVTQNGVMEPAGLYESPFSDIAPHGPDSIFPSADVDRLITILNSVRDAAASGAEVA
ncbi:type I restriction-modification enzyme R subunit C-terminal domain-containing protein [Micromonospora chersina]|uniref:type I restriction-modification enzyme R subunit C-terminal domain-containing protein n=1 Tax=Micromonospora chersina TaxID=47854 RepID=UPI000A7923E9|nr:type I restriction-modification enzyme R subunit C-terminal domain-containing protein [Micromonospora chersina]